MKLYWLSRARNLTGRRGKEEVTDIQTETLRRGGLFSLQSGSYHPTKELCMSVNVQHWEEGLADIPALSM